MVKAIPMLLLFQLGAMFQKLLVYGDQSVVVVLIKLYFNKKFWFGGVMFLSQTPV